MKQILGDRQSGKTHQLMQMYFEMKRQGQRVIVLVPNVKQLVHLRDIYRPKERHPDFEFFDEEDFCLYSEKLRGRDKDSKVLVDNIEWLFRAFIGYDVEAYTLNVENWPGLAGTPLPPCKHNPYLDDKWQPFTIDNSSSKEKWTRK